MSDYESLRDDAREEDYWARRRRRLTTGCLCVWPDMPGSCPGPENCPMHGENLNEEEER
jgi:hypothetical protein